MINIIYERNGKQYDWIQAKNPAFVKKIISSLGEIKIISIYETTNANVSRRLDVSGSIRPLFELRDNR